MKPYPEYKETGLTWLPKVPSGWKVERGKYLYEKASRPVRDCDEVVTCFRDGQVTLRKNRRLEGFTESLKECGYQGVRKGDLVIHVMDAFAGSVGVSDSDGKSTPVYSVCIPRRSGISNFYFAHVVRVMAQTGFIQSLYRGIRERSSDFRFDVFAAQFLPVPPPAEQERIVAYLDEKRAKIDRLIELKEREIELLNEKKQAMISRVVTRGLDPNVELVDSGVDWIGQVPRGWNVLPLKSNFYDRKEFFNGQEELIILSLIKDEGVIPYEEKGNVGNKSKDDISQYKVARCGDIVLNSMNVIIGSVGISAYDGYISPAYYSLAPRRPSVVTSYYDYLFHTPKLQRAIRGLAKGIMEIRLRVSQGNLLAVKFPEPPYAEQREIVAYLDKATAKIDAAIAAIEKSIGLLKERRTRLVSDAVTGRIDLREAVA